MLPEYVNERLKSVYSYYGVSLFLTAICASTALQIPLVRNLVIRQDTIGAAINLIATIGSGIVAHSIDYQFPCGPKHLAWLFHVAVTGATLAPVCLLKGHVFVKIFSYALVTITGFSVIALYAPKDMFLPLAGPLGMGSDLMFCASLGKVFLPPNTLLGMVLCFASLYGSIVLFVGFVLYDTQKILQHAEEYPTNPQHFDEKPYDPINAALSLYTNSLNIFIRVATVLMNGDSCFRKAID